MKSSKIVSEGAFNCSGLNENKTIKLSNLIITKEQNERIKERNKISIKKHLNNLKINKKEEKEKENNSFINSNNSLKFLKGSQRKNTLNNTLNSTQNSSDSLTGQTKLRNMKQKELAVKLEYMKKLQKKEEEVIQIITTLFFVIYDIIDLIDF